MNCSVGGVIGDRGTADSRGREKRRKISTCTTIRGLRGNLMPLKIIVRDGLTAKSHELTNFFFFSEVKRFRSFRGVVHVVGCICIGLGNWSLHAPPSTQSVLPRMPRSLPDAVHMHCSHGFAQGLAIFSNASFHCLQSPSTAEKLHQAKFRWLVSGKCCIERCSVCEINVSQAAQEISALQAHARVVALS